jgi:hypothetical protein
MLERRKKLFLGCMLLASAHKLEVKALKKGLYLDFMGK